MRLPTIALAAAGVIAILAPALASPKTKPGSADVAGSADVERGRYLVKVAGCNDCHTPGYAQAAGKLPESRWLVGDPTGWSGPWGTTYASNLRLYAQRLDEDGWVAVTRSLKARPPMPFWGLADMTETDLRAVYRFIRHLGPAGEPAPAALPPGQEPTGPAVRFPAPPD